MSFDRLIPDILFGFTGLIGIINPIGMAFVFLERTQSLTNAERAQLAKKVVTNIFFTLLVIFFVGAPVLNFFGISMEALRIGGGFAVAVAGWHMLNEPDVPARDAAPSGGDLADLQQGNLPGALSRRRRHQGGDTHLGFPAALRRCANHADRVLVLLAADCGARRMRLVCRA
jgi:hypothetical protein